jgi:hypothetical protein
MIILKFEKGLRIFALNLKDLWICSQTKPLANDSVLTKSGKELIIEYQYE